MTPIVQGLLTTFPEEINCHIAQYLTMKDIYNCLFVSRAWRNLFDSDIMWIHIAKQLNVTQNEINPIYRYVINSWLFQLIPTNMQNYFFNDYKNLVRQKLLLEKEIEENNIQDKYSKEFLEVFGSEAAIFHLPSLEITFDDMVHEQNEVRSFYYFKDEHFFAPIVRVKLQSPHRDFYFVLFKVINRETGKIYRDAIDFYSAARIRFFNIDNTRPKHRVISPGFPDMTKAKLERLQRLIQRKPVGIIVDETRSTFTEGPRITSDRKNLLELCE